MNPLFIVAGLALAAPPGPTAGLPAGYTLLDRIRVTVDDKVITQFELERALRPVQNAAFGIVDEKERSEWLAQRTKDVLSEQINTILLLEEAKKLDLKPDADQVASYIASLKANNGWSDEEFTEAVKEQGFSSLSAYTEHAEKEMLRTQVLQLRLASRIRPSQDDVERQFIRESEDGKTRHQIHAQAILLKVPAIVTPDQLRDIAEQAERVRQLAIAGETPFAELAEKYGEDRNKDGDLGWFGRCELDPEFERSAFALPVGEVSEVIRNRFGFHIIRVMEERRVPLTNPRELRNCILMNLQVENRIAAYDSFMQELRLLHNVEERE